MSPALMSGMLTGQSFWIGVGMVFAGRMLAGYVAEAIASSVGLTQEWQDELGGLLVAWAAGTFGPRRFGRPMAIGGALFAGESLAMRAGVTVRRPTN